MIKTQQYICPEIEIIKLDTEQDVLQNSSCTIEQSGDVLDETDW